jgi:Predicted flavoproteins
MCGGYNLQWAWSSGFVAGKSAGGSVNDKITTT